MSTDAALRVIEQLRKGQINFDRLVGNAASHKVQIQSWANDKDVLIFTPFKESKNIYTNFQSYYAIHNWWELNLPYNEYTAISTYVTNKVLAFIVSRMPNQIVARPIIIRGNKPFMPPIQCSMLYSDSLFKVTVHSYGRYKQNNLLQQNITNSLTFAMAISHAITDKPLTLSAPTTAVAHRVSSKATASASSLPSVVPQMSPVGVASLTKSPSVTATTSQHGGVGVPKAPHTRRGHIRHLKSGKRLWINAVAINNPTSGKVIYVKK